MSGPIASPIEAPLCPAGHGPMRKRQGRTGEFFGCTTYPACRETAPIGLPGILCPQCNSPIVERIAKKSGKPFWPCGNRACEFVAWEKPHKCRGCGGVCFGAERERMTPDAVPDPAIPAPEDDEVPF